MTRRKKLDAAMEKLDLTPAESKAKPEVAPTRKGKKMIAGYFSAETLRQLKQLGLDEDRTNQTLIQEALNDLFIKYNLPPIA